MTENEQESRGEGSGVSSRVEEFLRVVESKVTDEVYRGILRACRSGDPTVSMEAELKRVIGEIVHEA